MEKSFTPVEIFCSFAEGDISLLGQLESHLSTLRHERLVSTWHKRKIVPGSVKQMELDHHLDTASLILLLISSNFLDSDYCCAEMRRALQRHEAKEAQVIPILLRSCDWQNAPFAELEVLPTGATPVTMWHNRDAAWTDVVMAIRRALTERPVVKMQDALPEIHNLPFQPNPYFTGREKYLESLDQHFKGNSQVAVTQPLSISGLGGVGKTQLALAYAHRNYRKVYRTVLWVNAANQTTLEADYHALARLLQLPEKNEREVGCIVQAVKKWLEDHDGWLLILDNADDLELARSFLPTEPRGHILFTTRSQIVGTVAKRIEVNVMEREEGVSFLLRRSKRGSEVESLPSSVREAATRLVGLLGEHPLALDQAGAYIEETGVSFDNYIQKYRQQRLAFLNQYGPLDTKHPEHPETVVLTFEISIQGAHELCSFATYILHFCSFLHPDDIPEELLSQSTRLELSSLLFDQAIAALYRYSLIKRHAEKNLFSVHRLVQAVVQDKLPAQEGKEWIERALYALSANFPSVNFETWAQCERYFPHVLTCVELMEQRNFMTIESVSLLTSLGWYLRERARYKEAEWLLNKALIIGEKMLGSDHWLVGKIVHELAHLFYRENRYDKAELFYERALEIHKKVPNLIRIDDPFYPAALTSEADPSARPRVRVPVLDIFVTLGNLADTYRRRGKFGKALSCFQKAASLYESFPEVVSSVKAPHLAGLLSNWGLLYVDMGKYQEAEPLLQDALELREQLLQPDNPDIAISLNTLAGCYSGQERHREAELLLRRALEIDEKAYGPNHPEIATDLLSLAGCCDSQEKYDQAEQLYRWALTISETQQVPLYALIANILNKLGFLLHRQGDYPQAELFYRQALAIRETHLESQNLDTAQNLHNLGCLLHQQGDYPQAELFYKRALAIKQHLDPHHPSTAQSLNNLAELYQMQGKYKQAESLHLQALAIREEHPGPSHPTITESLSNLAFLYLSQGNYVQAEPLFKRALNICEQQFGPKDPRTLQVQKYYEQCLHSLSKVELSHAHPKKNHQYEATHRKARNKRARQSRKSNRKH